MDFEEKTQQFDASKMAARADARSACFIIIAGSQAGRLHKVDRGGIVIGRGPDAGIRLEEEGVSRRHCRVSADGEGSVVVEDLDSTNGTFVNGARITRHVLQDGDKLQVGRTSILKFSYQDSIDEDFQRRQYESATRDGLTSCFNKKYFAERLPTEVAFAQRHHKPICLAMFDIDHFKKVNDTYGHPAGDHVLRGVGQVLASMTRKTDVLCRFGGEEFAVIMREVSLPDAYMALERIRRQIEATRFEFNGQTLSVTISIGLAAVSQKTTSAEALVEEADGHLYAAKRGGRNRTGSSLGDAK